jgi:hypothetical protein
MRAALAVGCFLFVYAALPAQELVSATYLGARTKDQLIAHFNVPFIQFGVSYYKVTYTTPDLLGQPDTASGLLVVPADPTKAYPRLVYQHGTSSSKTNVPSNYGNPGGGEGDVGLLFGGMGYVALAPDYLGLGESRGFHPYVHAGSEASAAIDLLRASDAFIAQHGVAVNQQLFITGYSQGGHGAMALHRALETQLSNEFTVTAAAPMSGPYSLSGAMRDLILSQEEYFYPAYIPNTALSFQTVYGNIFNQLTDIFKQPYATYIANYFTGQIDLGALNSQLINALTLHTGASVPVRMLQDNVVQDIQNNPGHPINLALAANDVHNWAPQAPTRLFYCSGDDQVPFQNSLQARDSLQAAGAPDVMAMNVQPGADHGACVTPALTNTLFFFGSYQELGTVGTGPAPTLAGVKLSPNPASGFVTLENLPGEGTVSIVDLRGQSHLSSYVPKGEARLDVSRLSAGVYRVKFEWKGRVWQEKLVIQR